MNQTFIGILISTFVMAFIMAAMPWIHGVYWINVLGIFFCSLLVTGCAFILAGLVKLCMIWAKM